MGIDFNDKTQTDIKPSTGKAIRIWLIVVGILLVGDYAGIFIPAASGDPMAPASGYGPPILTGLFLYLLWRQRGEKGWVGALIGVAFGIFVFFVAAFVAGAASHA